MSLQINLRTKSQSTWPIKMTSNSKHRADRKHRKNTGRGNTSFPNE